MLSSKLDNTAKTSSSSLANLALYVTTFFGVWIFYVFLIYPSVSALGTNTLQFALLNLTAKLLIWVLPVFLYLCLVDKTDPLTYLKFRSNWKKAAIFTLLGTTFYFLVYLLQYGPPAWQSKNVSWHSILNVSFSVGFIEEILFRGFILQKLAEKINFWTANLLTALLFLLIHIPGWFWLGSLAKMFGVGMLSIALFGFVMGVLLRFSRSIWPAIITHSLNDFFSVLLWIT
jgi:uncharacterized protein